jgi:hypothetical protein
MSWALPASFLAYVDVISFVTAEQNNSKKSVKNLIPIVC